MKHENISPQEALVRSHQRTPEERDLIDLFEEKTLHLDQVPTLLQVIIDDYGFGNIKLTENDLLNIGLCSNMISDLLILSRDIVIDTVEDLKKIYLNESPEKNPRISFCKWCIENDISSGEIAELLKISKDEARKMMTGEKDFSLLQVKQISENYHISSDIFLT